MNNYEEAAWRRRAVYEEEAAPKRTGQIEKDVSIRERLEQIESLVSDALNAAAAIHERIYGPTPQDASEESPGQRGVDASIRRSSKRLRELNADLQAILGVL